MSNQDNYTYEEVLELTKQGVEIWRRVVIDGITFDYEVSNLGRIKSLKSNLGGGERVVYGGLDDYGYMRKVLSYIDENGNKKHKEHRVHRLVAIMFIPNPDNKPYVDHISTDKTNNKIDNLRWATHRENMNNSNTKKNISKAVKGKRNKLTDKEKYPYVTEEDVLVEEWRSIKSYEGIYEISNMGRVKSLGFKRNDRDRSKKGLLQPSIDKLGYQKIELTDRNSKTKTYRIHQLVAKHFIDNPSNYKIVDHINTNRDDNRYFNLRWVTQQENMNNDKTREKLKRKFIKPVIVLDYNGNIISNGLGITETAKNIGISESLLTDLLKSGKPYRTDVKNGHNIDLLRQLNGARMYYICEYNEEEVLKEIAEDKTDYSYCIGDLVCVYPDGRVSKPMSGNKLAKELGINNALVCKIRNSKKSYKVNEQRVSKERLEYLKTLNGIRIMYYEDYLKEQELKGK